MRVNPPALRAIRERTGLTQSILAEQAGIDRANYAHIEAGRRPGSAVQIIAIASALGVAVGAIVTVDEVVA